MNWNFNELIVIAQNVDWRDAAITLILVLLILFIGMRIISTIMLINIKNKMKQEVKKAYEAGLKEGEILVFQSLDDEPSVFNNVTNWIYNFQNQRQDVLAAKDIFTQLLVRLERKHDLKLIGSLGEMVRYEPSVHRTLETGLRKGDQVIIIEVGWQAGKKLLRRPMVGKDVR